MKITIEKPLKLKARGNVKKSEDKLKMLKNYLSSFKVFFKLKIAGKRNKS